MALFVPAKTVLFFYCKQCCGAGAGTFLVGWEEEDVVKAKTLFLLHFSLFLNEKEPEPVKKKVPEAEASQKKTGSATLVVSTVTTRRENFYRYRQCCGVRSWSLFDRLQVLFFTGSSSNSLSYKNRLKSSKKHVFAFTWKNECGSGSTAL